MYITRYTTVTDRATRDELFELYEAAYGDIAETDISREVLFRHEFDEVMSDPTYRTTVVRDDDDSAVAMATIATDIGATRYLSRPFFTARYPRRTAEQRVHYVMWAVVHPDHQGKRTTWELTRAGLAAEAEDGALLVFDSPESNQPNERGGSAEFLRRMAATIADSSLVSFGATRYYAIGFEPGSAETAVDEIPVPADAAATDETDVAADTPATDDAVSASRA